jgi:hypothetical protein
MTLGLGRYRVWRQHNLVLVAGTEINHVVVQDAKRQNKQRQRWDVIPAVTVL